jgi:hypothetical protein
MVAKLRSRANTLRLVRVVEMAQERPFGWGSTKFGFASTPHTHTPLAATCGTVRSIHMDPSHFKGIVRPMKFSCCDARPLESLPRRVYNVTQELVSESHPDRHSPTAAVEVFLSFALPEYHLPVISQSALAVPCGPSAELLHVLLVRQVTDLLVQGYDDPRQPLPLRSCYLGERFRSGAKANRFGGIRSENLILDPDMMGESA